jgi:hypothetical protein
MSVKHKAKYGVILLTACMGLAAMSGTAFAAKEAFKPLNSFCRQRSVQTA